MNSPIEQRLREALEEAGAALDPHTLRPLRTPERRRVRVDLRLVGVAAAAVAIAGAATAVALGTGGDEHVAAVEPAQSEAAEMVVFLCTKSAKRPPCRGQEATPAQVEAIETALRRLPQVNELSFEDQAAAYERFKKSFAGDTAMLGAVKAEDLPAAYRLKIKKGGDRKQVEDAVISLAGLAGIVNRASPEVTRQPTAEETRWQITAFLCQRGSRESACGSGPAKAVTAAQRQAIERLIRRMPQVAEYVYESKEAAYAKFKKTFADDAALMRHTAVEDMPESFRIALKDERKGAEVIEKLERQPGVAEVVYQRCVAERRALYVDFGLELPAGRVCS
ncbi:permease-like cell division protein FtsX [Nonomuraea sp. N2-4H]|jgi:cell division protein FtsX|uniref:permease-like cell division protein FtsX n=1 Tax=unclassified Nonomuraea TaxID=2593643 RepID=UPI0032449AAF